MQCSPYSLPCVGKARGAYAGGTDDRKEREPSKGPDCLLRLVCPPINLLVNSMVCRGRPIKQRSAKCNADKHYFQILIWWDALRWTRPILICMGGPDSHLEGVCIGCWSDCSSDPLQSMLACIFPILEINA